MSRLLRETLAVSPFLTADALLRRSAGPYWISGNVGNLER